MGEERAMPLPSVIAKINRVITNPVTRRFAGRVPPFAVVEHRGRTSGMLYRTPIMAFPSNDGFVVALTYGPETDWVRNVLAAGDCALDYRNQRIALTEPKLLHGSSGAAPLPGPVRFALRLLHVDEFLSLRRSKR
jgi:deazaflavin-dependent oxidoreductase (nitroreductase family)